LIRFVLHSIDCTVKSLTLHGIALLSHLLIDAASDTDFDHGYINAAMNPNFARVFQKCYHCCHCTWNSEWM